MFVSLGSFVSIIAGVLWGRALFSQANNLWIWLSIGMLCPALAVSNDSSHEHDGPHVETLSRSSDMT